jgi:hypothetical protein
MITEEIFEKAVKALNPAPVEPRYSYRSNVPIFYTNYDCHEKFNRIEEPEWDPAKDCEAKELEFKRFGPPPRPQFNQRNRGHKVIPIEDLIHEPGRSQRPEK